MTEDSETASARGLSVAGNLWLARPEGRYARTERGDAQRRWRRVETGRNGHWIGDHRMHTF